MGLENSIIAFILFIVFSVGYYSYFFKVYPPSVRVSDENRTRFNDVPAITQEVELPVAVLPPQGVQLPGAVLPPQGNQIGNIYNEENPLRDLLELANNPAFTDEERSVPVLWVTTILTYGMRDFTILYPDYLTGDTFVMDSLNNPTHTLTIEQLTFRERVAEIKQLCWTHGLETWIPHVDEDFLPSNSRSDMFDDW